ncbi:unnamed protein product, partial [Rotaria sp. Silwood2]
NITGFANNIEHQKQTYNYNNQKKTNKLPLNINHIPSLMSLNSFQQPSRRSCRTIKHAEQFKDKHPPIADPIIECYRNDNIMIKNKNKFNGLILSDSMCKHVRTEKLSSKQVHVKLSFESGCTCRRMSQFLEQQTKINGNDIFEANVIVYSLCTNDVGNIGATAAIKQCRELINLTRELFPKLQEIGWIALSPRSKPSRLYNSEEIGIHYHHFNQL